VVASGVIIKPYHPRWTKVSYWVRSWIVNYRIEIISKNSGGCFSDRYKNGLTIILIWGVMYWLVEM